MFDLLEYCRRVPDIPPRRNGKAFKSRIIKKKRKTYWRRLAKNQRTIEVTGFKSVKIRWDRGREGDHLFDCKQYQIVTYQQFKKEILEQISSSLRIF